MQNARLNVVEPVKSFELTASPDSPGMANLRINCLVSIPTGIRILALIDAEEAKPDDAGNGAAAEKPSRGRKRRHEADAD